MQYTPNISLRLPEGAEFYDVNDFNENASTLDTAIKDINETETRNANMILSHSNNESNPHNVTKGQIGLGNVENKSSETIRHEITFEDVVRALGYEPSNITEINCGDAFLSGCRFQVAHDTADGWHERNPVLKQGEFGYAVDTKTLKIGNGASTWDTLTGVNYDVIYNAAKAYTDSEINKLINGAPETLDTIYELAQAVQQSSSIIEALNAAIANKADKTTATQNRDGLMSSNDKIILDTLASQSGSNSGFDALGVREDEGSWHFTDTSDPDDMIYAYDTQLMDYTYPTRLIAFGENITVDVGSATYFDQQSLTDTYPSFKITLTAQNIADALGYIPSRPDQTPTSYTVLTDKPKIENVTINGEMSFADFGLVDATTTKHGMMSTTDKSKLDGIEAQANKYVHPTTTGYKHLPSGGSSGQYLAWLSNGTGTWANLPVTENTTYTISYDGEEFTMTDDKGNEQTVSLPAGTGGTVKSIATGIGLAGGTITETGAIKVDLKSETLLSESGALTTTAGRTYAVVPDSAGKLAVNVPWTDTDTVTKVKGNAELTYRDGNVNITPDNIGLGNVGNFKAVSTVANQGLTTAEKDNARTNIDLGNVGNFKAVSTVANQGLTEDEKDAARRNIGAGMSSFSGSYNDLTDLPELFDGQYSSLTGTPTLGDAASKGFDSTVGTSTTNVPSSNAVKQFVEGKNYITNAVNDLVNYYKKNETYTKTQVDQMISAIPKFAIEVVNTLPTTGISETTIYLVATGLETDNLYTEYIYVDGAWEKLGTQTVNLTGYVTGSGTSGCLAKFDDTYDLTDGPAFGSDTTKYLRNDGTWAVPPDNNDNTTYTFQSGTNQFTVTPSGGVSQTITVTPNIPNVITGTGENGYLTKFNGANSVTKGPQFGASTTTFLRNDGTWAEPAETMYSGDSSTIEISNKIVSMKSGVISPTTVGPSSNVTGTDGTTVTIPQITVDQYGRVTSITGRIYTSVDNDHNTTYTNATTSESGLMSALDKQNLDALVAADEYVGDGATITVSNKTISQKSGIISAQSVGPTANVTGNDGTTISIPRITVDGFGRVVGLSSFLLTNVNTDTNTTYDLATQSSRGLMSAEDKIKLDGIPAGGGSSGLTPTRVSGVLTAGQTSLTLTDLAITTNSFVQIYTSIYGVVTLNCVVSTGSATLTYEAQSVNMNVELWIFNMSS